jgi:prepilin-type N-terminal cleavage/methylation domain-containing protein
MKKQKGYTLPEFVLVVVVFGGIGALGYVALHFISKFW